MTARYFSPEIREFSRVIVGEPSGRVRNKIEDSLQAECHGFSHDP